jgi:hypothetical protein
MELARQPGKDSSWNEDARFGGIAFLHTLDPYRLPDQITDRVIRRPDAAPADRSASDAKISFQNARISLDLGVGPRARYDRY